MATRTFMSEALLAHEQWQFIAWIPEREFDRFRELFPARFPATYRAWARWTEEVIALERASGMDVRRVEVTADGFVTWCLATGRDPNGRALEAYTALLGSEGRDRHEGGWADGQ